MKKILYSLSILTSLGVVSCTAPLYDTPVDYFNMEHVFKDSIRAEAFLNNVMTERPDEINGSFNRLEGNSMLAAATDEATHVSTNKSAFYAPQKMSSGNWGPSNMRYYRSSDNVGEVGSWYRWGGYYGIRKACTALEGIEMMTSAQGTQRFINRLKAEAKFHIAISHFWLFQKWGGIPLVDRRLNYDDNLNISRASVEQTVQFILRLCDEAYELFPNEMYTADSELGRYDRGAVLALKSRLLLYAASPLYNGNGFDGSGNPLICYGNADHERWKMAAEAAQALIDTQNYSLYMGDAKNTPSERYGKYFVANPDFLKNCESIMYGRMRDPNQDTEVDNFPAGFTNAKGGTCPSQEMVDAYEMEDGTLFDWSKEQHKAAPYEKRDPRFYASIIYHGAYYETFANQKKYTFDMSEGGKNRSTNAATTTGYYLNKFMDYAACDPVTKKGSAYHVWPYFRYAEILLNYAEAANEYGGPAYQVADAKLPMTPIDAINLVRARAGMPDVQTTFARRGWEVDKDNLRKLIHNERRIELAFEEHRYYDVRRWMDIEDGAIHGVRITKENGEDKYEVVEVERKAFDSRKHYFFPIPDKEIRANKELIQNPGW